MGFLLGYLYWRLGLAGSISAHAVFNGVLVVLAFVSLLAGPETVTRSGIALDVPRSWHVVDETVAQSVDLAIESPTGAAIVVERSVPRSSRPAVRLLERRAHAAPERCASNRRRSRSRGSGRAVRSILESGTQSDVVVVPKRRGIFVVTLVDGGSEEAERRFVEILASVRLPLL